MWVLSRDHYLTSSIAVSNKNRYVFTSSGCKHWSIFLLPRITLPPPPLGFASAVWLFCFCDTILFWLEQVGKQLSCDYYFNCLVLFHPWIAYVTEFVLPVIQEEVLVLEMLSSRQLDIKFLYILFFTFLHFFYCFFFPLVLCLLIEMIYSYALLLRERIYH